MVFCRIIRRFLRVKKIFTAIFCIMVIFNVYLIISKSCHGLSCISPPSKVVMQINISPTNFLVHTSSCKIKDESPYESPPSKRRKVPPRQVCPPAAFTVSNNILRLTRNKAGKPKQKSCCLREITRKEEEKQKFTRNADWSIKTSKTCHPIPVHGFQLNSSSFIQVECDGEVASKNKSKYTDFVATVLPPEKHSKDTAEKVNYWKQKMMKANAKIMSKQEQSTTTNPSMPPSIFILGINGISRSHSLQALPKMREFLIKNDFIEMTGFTKIGLNTFENMMATLTGLPLTHPCFVQTEKVPLDDCPFIWKNFSGKNYITGMVEDSPGLGMFNYDKIGFIHQPVDYSIRTAFVALQRFAKVTRNLALNDWCMGGQTLFDNLFKYVREFLDEVGGKCPYFLVTWFKTLKAQFYDSITNEDDNFTHLLSDLLNKNSRYNDNNTLIIVLSAHGQELMGSMAGSYQSYYEEALPMNFIRIPASLKNIFGPHCHQNLQSNSKRLTTPYDLHATLKEILNLFNNKFTSSSAPTTITNHHQNENEGKFLGSSLFHKIPQNRSCPSASIPSKYCRCNTSPLLFNTSVLAQKLGNAITSAINLKLTPVMGHRLCVPLNFSRLLYGHRMVDDNKDEGTFVDYLVGIETIPSLAIFEGVVRDHSVDSPVVIGQVTRVSPGKNESFCITKNKDPSFQPYCFCYEVHLLQRIAHSKWYMKWSSRN